jgi:hypothetical protein
MIDGQLGTRGGQSTDDWAYKWGSGDGGSNGSAGSDGNTMVVRIKSSGTFKHDGRGPPWTRNPPAEPAGADDTNSTLNKICSRSCIHPSVRPYHPSFTFFLDALRVVASTVR